MEWAEAEYSADKAKHEKMGNWWLTEDARNLAAVHLYRLTGEDRWHRAFLETCGYRDQEKPSTFTWGSHVQSEAAMVYARLPKGRGDPAVKEKAKQAILNHARSQIDYASRQAYMFTANDIGAPLIISSHAAPRGLDICRAHYLTGDQRYLEWAVKSSQFSAGANPMNLVMTTGLGSRSAVYPLYLDMKYMARAKPPPGITLYGILDPQFNRNSWAYKWILDWQENCVPRYTEWPLSEFYFDVYAWPMVNEFTVQQSMAPAVYVWGYLAARGGAKPVRAAAARSSAGPVAPGERKAAEEEKPGEEATGPPFPLSEKAAVSPRAWLKEQAAKEQAGKQPPGGKPAEAAE